MIKHVHAELMLQYAHDAQETDKPWERWQWQTKLMQEGDVWNNCLLNPSFDVSYKYRRKPKVISVTLVNGEIVSWPEPIKHIAEINYKYFVVNHKGFVSDNVITNDNVNITNEYITLGLVHSNCDAAEKHARALYKINNQYKDN